MIAIHQVRSPSRWKRMRMTVPRLSKMPWRTEIARTFPISHTWTGNIFQTVKKTRAPMELTERKTLRKNAGIAWNGVESGLTRKRTIRREVTERRAERMMPNKREVIAR